MPNFQPHIRAGSLDDREVLTVALPEEPRELWTFRVEWVGREPFFAHLSYAAARPDEVNVRRRAATFHPPAARLVGIWCLWHGKNLDGTEASEHRDIWDGITPGKVAGVTRAPDPRTYGGDGTDEYAQAMHRWTEPIADLIDVAHVTGLSPSKAVELGFGISRSVAKKRVTLARQWNRRYAKTP